MFGGATIRLRGLSKAFGEKRVLDGVDLDIRAGHGMVILGGSGSGKSVTIKCILGLIAPDAGTIEVDGRDILAMPRREREDETPAAAADAATTGPSPDRSAGTDAERAP